MGGHLTQDRATELDFAVNDETWIIDKNVLIITTGITTDGVHSAFAHSRLINNGIIYTSGDTGVEFDGAHDLIVNNVGALIKGPYGVYTSNDHLTVNNFGT